MLFEISKAKAPSRGAYWLSTTLFFLNMQLLDVADDFVRDEGE